MVAVTNVYAQYLPVRFVWIFNDKAAVQPENGGEPRGVYTLVIRRHNTAANDQRAWIDMIVGEVFPVVNGKWVSWKARIFGQDGFPDVTEVGSASNSKDAQRMVTMGIMNSLYQSALRNEKE